MRFCVIVMFLFSLLSANAQLEKDTILHRCPVYITDTLTSNNFFLEFQPSTLKVSRVRGDLTVILQQREQYFTLFFHDNKLKNTKYAIQRGATTKSKVEAKYSFRAGEQVSFVDVRSGTVESSYDDQKKLWHLKIAGMIANLVERAVTYYKVRADLYFP